MLILVNESITQSQGEEPIHSKAVNVKEPYSEPLSPKKQHCFGYWLGIHKGILEKQGRHTVIAQSWHLHQPVGGIHVRQPKKAHSNVCIILISGGGGKLRSCQLAGEYVFMV